MSKPILIIDNDIPTVSTISDTLKSKGYEVFTAADGNEGLTASKQLSPSLILINLAVPGTEGLKICKTFLATEELKDIPLILLTAREGNYDPRYKEQYGIVDFLKKPVNPHELLGKTSQFALEDDELSVPPITEADVEPAEQEAVIEPEAAPDEFETEPVSGMDVEHLAEAEVEAEPETVEISEEVLPTEAEIDSALASYQEGVEPLTPIDEVEVAEEAISVGPDEETVEAYELSEAVEALAGEEEEIAEAAAGEWTISEEDEAVLGAEESPEWRMPDSLEAAETSSEAFEGTDWDTSDEPDTEEPLPYPEPEETPEWELPNALEAAKAEAESQEATEWGVEESEEEAVVEPETESAVDWSDFESGESKPPAEDTVDWSQFEAGSDAELPELEEMPFGESTETELTEGTGESISEPEALPEEPLAEAGEGETGESEDDISFDFDLVDEPAGSEETGTAGLEPQASIEEPSLSFEDSDVEPDSSFEEELEYTEVRPSVHRLEKRKSSKLMLPLLILLIVAVTGASAYFIFMTGDKALSPAPPPKVEVVKEEPAPAPPPAPAAVPEKPKEIVAKPAPKSEEPKVTKKVATKDVPAVKPTSKPASATSSKTYYVQFGAFKSRENAAKLLSQIKEEGYDAIIRERTSDGSKLYMVLLSDKFSERWTAFKQAMQIKELDGIGTAIYSE